MAYNNFIPTIWSETFLHECEQASVYLEDCFTEFQGEIKSGVRRSSSPMWAHRP